MKKLSTLLALVSLATVSVFAFNVNTRIKAPRPLPAAKPTVAKAVRPLPNMSKLTENARKVVTLSWMDYLKNLQQAAADFKTYDFKGNVHPYLSEMDTTTAKTKDIAFAVKDYQTISGYFREKFKKDPQQGTLAEYAALYEGLNNLSPREYNILPTIAVWQTGSLEAVLPYQNQNISYWETPLLAAKAYDIMAQIDKDATEKTAQRYIRFTAGNPKETGSRQTIKKFFDTWRNQANKALPSVKDADALEKLVLTSN